MLDAAQARPLEFGLGPMNEVRSAQAIPSAEGRWRQSKRNGYSDGLDQSSWTRTRVWLQVGVGGSLATPDGGKTARTSMRVASQGGRRREDRQARRTRLGMPK